MLYVPDFGSPDELVSRVDRALRSGDETGTVELPAAPIGVLVRPMGFTVRALLPALEACRAITRRAGATLLLRGRADLAASIDADGLHLPSGGLVDADARRLAASRLVGRACHDAAELAEARGSDYALLSPVFDVPGKPGTLGIEHAAALTRAAPVPVLWLGGITPETAATAVAAGAHGVAVRRAIDEAPDPAAELRRFLSRTSGALAP